MTQHSFDLRVYYEDTDTAGIVYYANYLKFMERARTEALRDAGIEQSALMRETGIGFVVRRCAVEFLKPAKLDDRLTIQTRLTDIRKVSMDMRQTVLCGQETLVTAEVVIAVLGPDSRPVRMPPFVHDALLKLLNP